MNVLVGVRDGATVDQIEHTVAEHLRVYAQIFVTFQRRQRSVGNGADT